MQKHLLVLLASVAFFSARAAESHSNYAPESRSTSEIFTSKVLKVYAFQEGDLDYVAYVVNWKDHEVVVTAMPGLPSAPRLNVGDSIRCRMDSGRHRIGDTDRPRLMFSIFPFSDETSRLKAISDEVEARRAIREAALEAASRAKSSAKPAVAP